VNITQSLRRAVQINPNGIATIDGDRQQTWSEFAQRVSALAGGLTRNLQLQQEDRVAILSLNSDYYLETKYAIAWAGLIAVPLNIRLAPEELIFLLNDSETRVLIVDETFSAMLPAFEGKLTSVETIINYSATDSTKSIVAYQSLIVDSEPAPDANAGNDDTAGIFYTGGTTGLPKGVMLTHDNLVHNALNCLNGLGYNADTRYLHAAPMFHAADATSNIAVTMLGGTHVFIPKFEPEQTLQLIEKQQVTNCTLVPTMINMLVNTPNARQYDLSSLKRLAYGASPMPEAVLKGAQELIPNTEFSQAYGMTELSPIITLLAPEFHDFEGPFAHRVRSAGNVVLTGEIRVVDEYDQPLPNGSIGEVIARGPTVMKGYWRREAETAEAKKNGWMHTGDAGYMDDDGYLYIADRVKDMIVSGGENVYSVEVENALYQHPAVESCAVIGIPSEAWGEQVHAIVILHAENSATEADILNFCKEKIASYKVPRSLDFRTIPLPVSGAGKILKTELRKPFWEGRSKQVN